MLLLVFIKSSCFRLHYISDEAIENSHCNNLFSDRNHEFDQNNTCAESDNNRECFLTFEDLTWNASSCSLVYKAIKRTFKTISKSKLLDIYSKVIFTIFHQVIYSTRYFLKSFTEKLNKQQFRIIIIITKISNWMKTAIFRCAQ